MVQVNMKGAKEPKPKFEHLNFHVLIDAVGEEPVKIEAGNWKGIDHIGIRQLFRGNRDGLLYYGKQGFNIPAGDFLHVIIALVMAYNKATGSALNLLDGNSDGDSSIVDIYELVVEEMAAETEAVHVWKGNQ